MAERHHPKPVPYSSIPPHLRPPLSHASSGHSSLSLPPQPHPQQHEFVPSFDAEGLVDSGLHERALFDLASSRAGTPSGTPLLHTPISEHGPLSAGGGGAGGSEAEWDTTREDSIARRPKWRRPSPTWVYPFIVGAAVSLGMATPPKSELFINLACLAHPPRIDKSDSLAMTGLQVRGMDLDFGVSPQHGEDVEGIFMPVGQGANGTVQRSPADEWFIRLQHDIYEYRKTHPKARGSGNGRGVPSSKPVPGPQPTGPLPKQPWGDSGEDGEQGGQGGEPDDEPSGERTGGGPFEEIDPQLCKRDAKVQAAAAKLTMVLTLTMGVLSALTTGFWGQTSDRLGRTKVMAIVELGLLLNEICFILVATFPYLAPGGYRSLLIGPTIEGLLGGFSTITATVNAYVSDVTPDGSRVTVFARLGGIMMAGFAVGPVVGSMVISYTGNIMVPFYINLLIHSVYIILILFLLPESLSSDARLVLAKNALIARDAAARREAAEREWEDETPGLPDTQPGAGHETDPLLSGWSFVSNGTHSRRRKKTIGTLKRGLTRLISPLAPLAIFLPREEENPYTGRRQRNWNLTAVGLGLFFMSMLYGILATKTQFTFYAYAWTSAQLGPYMSTVAFLRSFVLIGLVPLVMRFVKPRFFPAEPTPEADADASAITTSSTSSSDPPTPPAQRSAQLDLLTARFCLVAEFIPWTLLALGPSQTGFVVLSIFLTFGSPATPAANSLALSLLPDASQSGRLFGALSVIHALGATLISPLMFGTLFASTVGWYAPTVFALAAGCVAAAFGCLAFVRLNRGREEAKSAEERGRSRKVKRVNSTSVYGASGLTVRSGLTSRDYGTSGVSGVAGVSGVTRREDDDS
ncbi:hypothetical protein IAT38_005786 [Cryptococcus sp. DSM 104549]